VRYRLASLLAVAVCAVLAGACTFAAIADWARIWTRRPGPTANVNQHACGLQRRANPDVSRGPTDHVSVERYGQRIAVPDIPPRALSSNSRVLLRRHVR
jgi:hypothetical protein